MNDIYRHNNEHKYINTPCAGKIDFLLSVCVYIDVLLSTYIRSKNIITTNTEYIIDPQIKIEETTLYWKKTLEVGQHHTMDPIMEGVITPRNSLGL
jgi:hypothetical protein